MEHTHDIQKEVRRYLFVFAALLVLTIITVAISYLKVSTSVAVILALIVASTKGTLVACFFMHLISEKQFIYVLLTFTAIFFLSLGLIIIGQYSTPQGTDIWQSDQRSSIVHSTGHHADTSHDSQNIKNEEQQNKQHH